MMPPSSAAAGALAATAASAANEADARNVAARRVIPIILSSLLFSSLAFVPSLLLRRQLERRLAATLARNCDRAPPKKARSRDVVVVPDRRRPLLERRGLRYAAAACGRSSVVERQLPKLYVVGSIPIARSNF